jgi:hypothetical protein
MSEPIKISEKVPAAMTALVTAFSKEITHLFEPQYTVLDDKKKRQTNPYAELNDAEKMMVCVDSGINLIAQLGAESVANAASINGEAPSIERVYEVLSRKMKKALDDYHQLFLQMREDARDDKNNVGEGTDKRSDDTQPAVSDTGLEAGSN